MLSALVKIQLSALFAQTFKKKNSNSTSKAKVVGYIVLFAFLFLYLAILLGAVFMTFTFATVGTDLEWAPPALASLICTAICFVGTVFSTQSVIYNSKDNDLLIAMPIPPKTILLSRITTLAVMNYFFSLLVFLPLIAVETVFYGPTARNLSISALTLLVPMLAMTVTLAVGWLIALITSKLRNKNAVTVVLSAVVMGLYLLACANLGNFTESLAEDPTAVTDFLSSKLGLFALMGKTVSNFDVLSFIAVFAICVLPFVGVCALLSRSFYKIATERKGAKKKVYVKKEMKTSSKKTALAKKEFAKLFSSPAYFMNSFMGGIFAIICAVIIAMNADTLSELTAAAPFLGSAESLCSAATVMLTVLVNSMNVPSAVSISLEGKTLWILKTMPIKAEEILGAKISASAVATAIPNLILATVATVCLPTSPLGAAAAYLTAITSALAASGAGVAINTLMPRLDWVNETVCIKQSGSVIVALLSLLGSALVICFVGGVICFFSGATAATVFLTVFLLALGAFFGKATPKLFAKKFENL